MTPLKSIRKNCLWCANNFPAEVRICSCKNCSLFPFRMGKKTKKGSLIKVIKRHCFNCGEGTAQKVRACDLTDCFLFPYRNGESPAHKQLWANRLKRAFPRKKQGLLS